MQQAQTIMRFHCLGAENVLGLKPSFLFYIWQEPHTVKSFGGIDVASFLCQLRPVNTETRNGFAEICNRNNKLDVHAVWMQMCICVSGQWSSRTSIKIVVCIDSKHHSQGTAPRTLFPDAQLWNVLLIWLPQGFPSDKSTARMICQCKILRPNTRNTATQWQCTMYAISFPFNPTGKQICISNKGKQIMSSNLD